jgi:hypothetical protein
LLEPRTTPNLEKPPLIGCPLLLIQYIRGYLHIGGRSSIRNLSTRHAVLTGTHVSTQLTSNYVRYPALVRHPLCCCIGSWALPYECFVFMCRKVGCYVCNPMVRPHDKYVSFTCQFELVAGNTGSLCWEAFSSGRRYESRCCTVQ